MIGSKKFMDVTNNMAQYLFESYVYESAMSFQYCENNWETDTKNSAWSNDNLLVIINGKPDDLIEKHPYNCFATMNF